MGKAGSEGESMGCEGRGKRIAIVTFGCQMNTHDSERVRDLLIQDGYGLSGKAEEADVILFNTCSVRKHAEDRVFGNVSGLKALKNRRPEIIIGILGCMAEAQRDLIFKRLPHVDFLCGPAELDKIPGIIERIRRGAGHVIYLEGHKSKRMPDFSKERAVEKHAYVKIMEGCSNFCSYCIVPYVRGEERSRPSKEILKEIEGLIAKGVEQITLLGQNVNSYGRGLGEKIDFPELLMRIDRMIRRDCFAMTKVKVDFVTSHSKDASIDLFKAMGELESISKKLHLPLQSGSDRILKRMNRKYTVGKYKKLVSDFRKLVRGSELLTDLIVGFPGETERDFEDTLKAVREIQFDAAYIFKYSPRPFTKASEYEDDVPRDEKERRHRILLETQKRMTLGKVILGQL